MQTANLLETPEYPNPPNGKSDLVRAISREKLAWLAGIVDGEGSMGVTYHAYGVGKCLRFQVGNISPFMISEISKILKELRVRFFYQVVKTKTGKFFWRIDSVGFRSVLPILQAIRDFSVSKKDQIDAILKFGSWRETIPHNPSAEQKERIIGRFAILQEQLTKMKNASFNPQRLPRRASEVLDVSRLEAMV